MSSKLATTHNLPFSAKHSKVKPKIQIMSLIMFFSHKLHPNVLFFKLRLPDNFNVHIYRHPDTRKIMMYRWSLYFLAWVFLHKVSKITNFLNCQFRINIYIMLSEFADPQIHENLWQSTCDCTNENTLKCDALSFFKDFSCLYLLVS